MGFFSDVWSGIKSVFSGPDTSEMDRYFEEQRKELARQRAEAAAEKKRIAEQRAAEEAKQAEERRRARVGSRSLFTAGYSGYDDNKTIS